MDCLLLASVVVLGLALPASLSAQASAKPRPAPAKPESFEQLQARARAALEAQQAPEAIRLFTRATGLRPTWAEGWWHLGALQYDAGRFQEAHDAFARFVSVEKRQPGPGHAMLGLSAFQLQRYPEALAALERGSELGLGANPAFHRSVLYHLGILHNRLGRPEVGLTRLTRAVNEIAAAHPDAPRAAVFADEELADALGIVALRRPKLPTELAPDQAGLIRMAGRAQALTALQDRAAAEPELKRLTELFGSEPGVHYMYGVFLLEERAQDAITEFRREIEAAPDHAPARIQIALAYLRLADFEQGLKYAQEAVRLAPQDFVARVACGRLYLALEKPGPAVEELQAAVKLAPTSPDARFALSRALNAAGRTAEAQRERAEFERLKALSDAARR